MTRLLAIAAVLALFLAAGSVLAQGAGGLVVAVIDEGGLPLPGATVVLSHAAGNVKPFALQTDMKGRAEFPVLRPGQGYIIEVSMPSFGTRREEGIRVPIGDTTTVAVQMSEEMVEHIRVVSEDAVVRLEITSSTSRFSDEFMQDLPIPGRFYQNVLTLAPGVNDPDGDGNPTVHGSRSRDFRAEVGGVSNVNPLTGQFMSLVNSDSIEEMEVVTGGAGVEFGRAQGGFARIIQKQGTNQFEGTFSLLYRSSKLDGTGANDNTNLPDPEFGEVHPALQLSGPIVRDKLWYRLSHEVLDQQIPVNTVGQLVTQDVEQEIHADQLTWQVSPRNKLAFQISSDPFVVSNFGVSSTTPAESSQTIDTSSRTYSVTWTAPYSPTLLVETVAAWQDLESSIRPSQPGVANNCVKGNPFLENTLCRNFQTQETSGSHFLTNENNSQRFSLNSQATLYGGRFLGANHQFKFGVTVENERYFRRLERRPEIGFDIITPISDPSAEQTPEEIKIITATVGIPSETQVRSTGTNWGAYIEDQIKPTNNLVVTLGVRVDREELNAQGMTPFDPLAERELFFERLGTMDIDRVFPITFTKFEGVADFMTELSNITGISESQIIGNLANVTRQSDGFWRQQRQLGDFEITNTNVSPAIAVSWDPWSSGKNKFAASARRYYDKIILAIPLIENNPDLTTLVFNADDTPQGTVAVNALRSNINPAISIEAVDRNLRTPYQDEWRLVYERELFTETLMRVEYVNRKYRDQLQNIDINHVPGDFGTCRIATLNDPRGLISSPGAGHQLTDPYTFEVFTDTDPGVGDGRIDDCVGDTEISALNLDRRLQRRDGITDLYTSNPAFGAVLVVGNYNQADYEAFVFELIRRQFRSWELQASYTWSMAEGNGEDFRQFLGLDASILDDEFGYQSNDQRHVFKASATTITPWGFRLGGRATWSSGLPYSILEQGLAFDAVPPAYLSLGSYSPARNRLQYPTGQRNTARNAAQWLFDVKFTKEFNFGHGLNMQLSAEIFNLLNDGTYQVYNPNFETGFQINGIDNARFEFGRRWQLGMRMSF